MTGLEASFQPWSKQQQQKVLYSIHKCWKFTLSWVSSCFSKTWWQVCQYSLLLTKAWWPLLKWRPWNAAGSSQLKAQSCPFYGLLAAWNRYNHGLKHPTKLKPQIKPQSSPESSFSCFQLCWLLDSHQARDMVVCGVLLKESSSEVWGYPAA